MIIEQGSASHVGRVRATNEDSLFTGPSVAVVADGMGGHACGDVASALAVARFEALGAAPLTPAMVDQAVFDANASILAETAAAPEKAGMGTTLSGVALVTWSSTPHWLVFNVGDSRVYRRSGEELRQLTVDHSEVAALVAAGRITAAEARTHPLRNIVTRSIGMDPPPAADTWIFPVDRSGDEFLICSDGLTTELEDTEIVGVLRQGLSAEDTAKRLVSMAVEAGGRDNVTVVVVRSHADDDPDELSDTAPRSYFFSKLQPDSGLSNPGAAQ